jgi:hypothetical protein
MFNLIEIINFTEKSDKIKYLCYFQWFLAHFNIQISNPLED